MYQTLKEYEGCNRAANEISDPALRKVVDKQMREQQMQEYLAKKKAAMMACGR